jgi:hypothetical protein
MEKFGVLVVVQELWNLLLFTCFASHAY